MTTVISSLQNGRIKQVVKLRQRRQRDEDQLTVVEGVREVNLALKQGIIPIEAYICPELVDPQSKTAVSHLQQLSISHQTYLFEVTPDVYAKMAYRENSGGILLIIAYLPSQLSQLPLSSTPFLAVIEDVEKPGNLGAILRTADAVGVDGVIICYSRLERGTDLHNPNVIRASLGTIFTVPVALASSQETVEWLYRKEIGIVATTPDAVQPYTAVSLTSPTAIVMGSEAHGLSQLWLKAARHQVVIPMAGLANSLNLSVSTALLLYEVMRQRQSGL